MDMQRKTQREEAAGPKSGQGECKPTGVGSPPPDNTQPTLEQAQKFLVALDPSTDRFTFQTFDDNDERKDRSLVRILHGTLAQHWDKLVELSGRGAGIFVTVNETDFKGRKAENITRIRYVFVDLDGAPLEPAKKDKPHIINESSPKKWHAYWRVEGLTLEDFKGAQRALAARYNGDTSITNLDRVMRLPGFPHQKGKPFISRIVKIDSKLPTYAADEFKVAAPAKKKVKTTSNLEPIDLKLVEAALEVIPADKYDEWRAVCAILHTDIGGEEGLRLLDRYSRKSDRYDEKKVADKYWSNDMHDRHIGTLFQMASDIDPGWRGESAIDVNEKLTELGNAKRLVRQHGENLRFVHAWDSWMIWEGGQWRKDSDGGIMRLATATVDAMFAEASKVNDPDRRNALLKHAMASQKANQLKNMVTLAESDARVVLSPSKLNSDIMLLGVKNGVVDLRTGAFREAQRDDYVTKQAGAAYDANAMCPNWEAFLLKFFVDKELIAYVQRACGYILTGLTGEEVMFFLWGSGANGKSTFRETLFALMGDYAIGADAGLLITRKNQGAATPDLVRLHGARLVTVNETEEKDHLNESRVKFITSHDIITARNLYKEPFDFTPTHKAVVTTNHKPIVRGTDEGIWRRLHLWPFTVKVSNDDKVLNFREQKLLPELPGILNWALRGLKEYQRVGLKPPSCVTAATDEYREDMDIIGQWIEERCTLDKTAKYRSSYLYTDYSQWSEQEVGFKISAVAFGRALSERGFKKIKKMQDGGRGFAGLTLRPLPNSRRG